jgi:nucleoid-associated protein EbfC
MKLPGNMASIMQAAQSKMKNLEEDMKKLEAEASSGGDMVRVKVNGSGDVLSVKISPDILKENDVEMLEDLVLSAVNEAFRKVRESKEEKIREMTGGIDLASMGLGGML